MNPQLPVSSGWGPFALGLDPCELRARLQSLRSIAHLILGPRAEPLTSILAMAEVDVGWLDHAAAEVNALPTRDRRNVLSSYGAINCPNWQR